jgi:hypothetical protein
MSSFEVNEELQSELELLEAAYGDAFQRKGNSQQGTVSCRVGLCSRLSVTLTFPMGYPYESGGPLLYSLENSSSICSKQTAIWRARADSLIQSEGIGTCIAFQLLQMFTELMAEFEEQGKHDECNSDPQLEQEQNKVREVSRILIWTHHIMSGKKKEEITTNASFLNLGGVWKDGFPGIIVVEGLKEDAWEFVRRIQRLRWQHLVVRGEQNDLLDSQLCIPEAGDKNKGDILVGIGDIVNSVRVLPMPLEHCGADMSLLATRCKAAGLEDLFRTSMKMY